MTVPATPPPNAPSEPLWSVGTLTAAATAVVAAVVAFGVNLSTTQTGAIIGVVAVLAPLIVSWVGRNKVFSPATVRTMVKAAENKPVV
jgi:hypothetical protein